MKMWLSITNWELGDENVTFYCQLETRWHSTLIPFFSPPADNFITIILGNCSTDWAKIQHGRLQPAPSNNSIPRGGNGGHTLDYVARNLWGKLMSRPEWMAPNLLTSSIMSACHNLDKGLKRGQLEANKGWLDHGNNCAGCNDHLYVCREIGWPHTIMGLLHVLIQTLKNISYRGIQLLTTSSYLPLAKVCMV